jgi:hypothetical protein
MFGEAKMGIQIGVSFARGGGYFLTLTEIGK